MTYLLLAIICSAIIPNIFRFGEQHDINQPVVITVNYAFASLILLITLLFSGLGQYIMDLGKISINEHSVFLAIIIGIITGIFYYGGFYYYQKSVFMSGPSIATAFGKIGIIIPMILSIIIWKEVPNIIQWFGVVISLGAILIMAINLKEIKLNDIHVVLIFLFLFTGLGSFTNKVFQKYCMIQHNQIFLWVLFTTALVISLKETRMVKEKKKWDYYIGMMVGIPNILSSYFLIQALNNLTAVVVFPLLSGGTIIGASLISAVVFKERLKSKEYIGIGMMIVAVMLINYA
ncbi:SMR family transporter [Abyssisolibacter fermentans]|uniref:SMR family transporter n=1 Tax=Abyssisolibacter fermentans TaxID=1766203 RepID=UPI00082E5FF0|nr:SMR family transporter [Abyssisolibacter fermentans]